MLVLLIYENTKANIAKKMLRSDLHSIPRKSPSNLFQYQIKTCKKPISWIFCPFVALLIPHFFFFARATVQS